MATAAFRSTTKRSSIGDSGAADDCSSSNRDRGSVASSRRRARSVSRFSHRLTSESAEFIDKTTTTPMTATKGKFVNTARGAEFPEISLDDLAIELFSSSERGRSSEVSAGTAASQRRGRSVSRQTSSRVVGERRSVVGGRSNGGRGSAVAGGSRVASDRRRRSLSVVRYRASDSESENSENYTRQINSKSFSRANKQQATVHKQATSIQQRGLRRCSSQRDFLRSNDGYSSYFSILTDDETRDARYGNDGFENLRHTNARKKSDRPIRSGLNNDICEVTRKELKHVVDEIRMGVEQVGDDDLSNLVNGGCLQQKNLDVLQGVSTKLEQSEKRKQELLAQIMLEERHSKELRGIVGELLPNTKETYASRRSSHSRKRSNDRRRISKQLEEEADKIIEDFISSVEDNTDISSFDGDRSDTSSTFGVPMRAKDVMMHFGEPENYTNPRRMVSLPVEMDGVAFPWLQWETSNESSLQSKDKKQLPATPKTVLHGALEEIGNVNEQEHSNQSKSSRGSWSPAFAESFSMDSREVGKTIKPADSRKSQLLTVVPRRSRADIDDYLASWSNEERLFEILKCRDRISSGGILICEGSCGPILL